MSFYLLTANYQWYCFTFPLDTKSGRLFFRDKKGRGRITYSEFILGLIVTMLVGQAIINVDKNENCRQQNA